MHDNVSIVINLHTPNFKLDIFMLLKTEEHDWINK